MFDRTGSEKLKALILNYVIYVNCLKLQNYKKNIIIFEIEQGNNRIF